MLEINRVGVGLLVAVAASLGFALPDTAEAQDARMLGSVIEQVSPSNPLATLRRQAALAASQAIVLEGPLDPSSYVVGPGDQFSISIGGPVPSTEIVKVAADGRLVVGQSGGIQVGGRSLAETQTLAKEALQESYENVGVEVVLVQPRMFYVHVVGAVPQPGRYLMTAVARVEDAVQNAYAKRVFDLEIASLGRPDLNAEDLEQAMPTPTSERPILNSSFRPSLRNVMVARADGTRRSIDLMSYYATGDTENNPYLLDGDVIEIPPYHEFRDVVEVYGPVPFAGRYPFRPGDTVTRVLRIGLGTTDLSSVDRVRVTSRADDGSQSVTVDVAAIVAGDALDVPLRVGDTVRIEQFDVPTAAVYGQVRYPGIYPINAGQTTVKELLETVGGLIDDADLAAAYMERQRPSFLKGTPGVSDLDFFGRALFQRARQASRIAVDIEHLLSSDDDFVLESGDVLVVPRRQTSVYVVGNVPAGGYVPFIEGADAAYYIEQAGGRASLSREVYVFRPTSGEVRKGLSQPVRSGETIYVDREPFAESPDLQNLLLTENTSRRQLKLLSTQTVISGVSAIAAIITTVVAIRR